jgi:ATP-dependent DNA ligase
MPLNLIELNGDDLRRDPLEVRKATLASVVAKPRPACTSTSKLRAGRAGNFINDVASRFAKGTATAADGF